MPPRFLLRLQLPVLLQPVLLQPELLQLELLKELLNPQVLERPHDEVLPPLEQLRFRELVP
jgi:hypothetical protein